MAYAIVFLPLVGALIGYLGKNLIKNFVKFLPIYPMIDPNKGKNKIAYSI